MYIYFNSIQFKQTLFGYVHILSVVDNKLIYIYLYDKVKISYLTHTIFFWAPELGFPKSYIFEK